MIRKSFLIFLMLTCIGKTYSQGTITLVSGGDAISADGYLAGYTVLSGPTYTEGSTGDVGTGTIILNAPAGFEFNTAASTSLLMIGGRRRNRNINNLNTGSIIAYSSITTTQITFNITAVSQGGANKVCTLTFQDVQVRPSTGIIVSGNLTKTGTSVMDAVTNGVTNFGTLTVVAGALSKLQILVPGENYSPGPGGGGKTGTPSAQTAGAAFNVTVNAVDQYWNIVTSTTDIVDITSSDANATLPASAALVSGTKVFGVVINTAGSETVTASDYTTPAVTLDTSPGITINTGPFSKLQILMPGEIAAPGTPTGKTGSPNTQTAGSSCSVTVNAVDDNWNLVNTITDIVGITTTDVNATLPANSALVAGTQTYNITFITAGSATVTSTDISDGGKSPDTSPSTTINAGAFVKLQMIVPGETAAPGTPTGKTGITSAQNLGAVFSITVNAVDANWNVVSSATDEIDITSTDGTFTDPVNAFLVSGTKKFNITFNTAGNFTLTASDITDGGKTANTSPSILVVLSILSPATGGSAISADDYLGGYTTLSNPAFTEGASSDVGTGTIVLDVPSGVIFDVGGVAPTLLMTRVGGSGADALNINGLATGSSIALTSISTTQITFTIASASSAGVLCKLQFKDVRVRPSTGEAGSGDLTKSGSSVMNGVNDGFTSFGTMTVVAGAFTHMQVLVPGETAAPGTPSGKTGTPSNQTAGTAFNVTANGVDQYWNVVSTTNTVGLTSTDVNATLPGNTALVAGTKNLAVILNTIGAQTLTLTNITDGGKVADVSSSITVDAGVFTKLQILLPGETADPGSPTGKTGTPTAQTAGASFNVTVNAVDDAWNVVSSTNTVGITSNDANATLPANAVLVAGTQTFAITLNTAGVSTVTSSNITDGTKTANTSADVTVNVGAFTKLQILVPGETADPGSPTGKTGTPDPKSSTKAFTLTVNAVDANWNVVSSTDVVRITSSDGSATLPGNAALVAGTQTFNITINSNGPTETVTATDITDGGNTPDTSPDITIILAIVTEATGGSAISADDVGGVWTTLNDPIFAEGTVGDVSTGTIVLSVPTGFEFNTGAATILTMNGGNRNNRNINNLADGSTIGLTITATTITATITDVSTRRSECTLTYNNIQVRPTIGAETTGDITHTGTSSLLGVSASTNFGTLTVIPGAFDKMQILVPGETAVAGPGSGKSGTPIPQSAGTAFNVTANAVDQYWNLVTTVTDVGGITSSDVNAVLPANAALVSGTQLFSVTLNTIGGQTVTLTDITDAGKTSNTSPSITVNAGAFAKMQLLVPGETADPGTPTGKTGTPTGQAVGVPFIVTVNAVDDSWNVVSSTNVAGITSSDGGAILPADVTLVAGTQTFNITFTSAGTWTVTGSNITDGTKTSDTSPGITATVTQWVWDGDTSTDWFTGANWSTGVIPNEYSAVVIPGGTPDEPTITGAVAYCLTLSINTSNGGKLTINYSGGGNLIK